MFQISLNVILVKIDGAVVWLFIVAAAGNLIHANFVLLQGISVYV